MKTMLVSIALSALLAAGAAQAEPSGTYTATIRSGDLNLATPGGLATFHGRVRAAANRICGSVPVLPFNEAAAVSDCRAQLFRSADRQVALALATPDSRVVGTR